MKLVQQTTLFFQEGKSDKVYEVDLCEVGSDRYVVNFRYGRRGSTLREGTKTTSPVSRDEANRIFNELVQSKTKKGYTDGETPKTISQSASQPEPSGVVDAALADETPLGPRELAVLERLRQGNQSQSRWKLSRAIWRAGELGITAAEPLLHGLVRIDAMTNYCVAWTMGRLGQQSSLPVLQWLAQDTSAPHTAQIAVESMRMIVDETELRRLIDNAIDSMPAPLSSFLKNNSQEAFQNQFLKGLGTEFSPDLLNVLYYIDNEIARSTLLEALRQTPLEPPYFRSIRRIFKASELRQDGQVFGLLAHRIETHRSRFRVPAYTWRNYQKPTIGENPEHACSLQTRNYLRGRTWWTLKRLGEIESSDFVPMAVGTLLAFSDEDARPVRTYSRYNYQTREYENIDWGEFGGYWAFNQLLYRNSSRYRPLRGKKSFYVAGGLDSLKSSDVDESAFPHLWRQQPRGLLHLLTDSRCRMVHEFAARAIRDCKDFCNELPTEVLILLLGSPYDVTVELGFDLAVERYDEQNPDLDLVLALANCSLERARAQARTWIGNKRSQFFAENDFVVSIMTSPYSDTRAIVTDSLYSLPDDDNWMQLLVGRLIAFLQNANADQAGIANDLGTTLLRSDFERQVSTLGEEIICDLLQSELPEVQTFAGSVVLAHSTLAQSPTERILRAMLDATHPPVRAMGIKVISGLSDRALTENVNMLAGLSCHPLEDIREEIRPVVKRLADLNSTFARQMAAELIRRLLIPGAPEGVPSHTSRILREDFARRLDQVSSETVWKLLQSRSEPAQEVGGFLLPTNVAADSLQVREIVKLANHQILTVRQAAWKMIEENDRRMQEELSTAVRILDSDWDDSRQFGFQYIREKVDDRLLTPEVMISVCDSVREDVQQFGRELITKQFAEADGPEYLMKLSEHPSADLQLFASNFLVEYGSGDSTKIAELAPYFVSILSRVNKSRVAKDRVLEFLAAEAVKSRGSADIIGKILTRLSATCAIGDRATSIEAMLDLHEAFSEVELPIELKPVEVR